MDGRTDGWKDICFYNYEFNNSLMNNVFSFKYKSVYYQACVVTDQLQNPAVLRSF